jgi:hypothetical protein
MEFGSRPRTKSCGVILTFRGFARLLGCKGSMSAPSPLNRAHCRAMEWRITVGIPLAVSTVSSFVSVYAPHNTSAFPAASNRIYSFRIYGRIKK